MRKDTKAIKASRMFQQKKTLKCTIFRSYIYEVSWAHVDSNNKL